MDAQRFYFQDNPPSKEQRKVLGIRPEAGVPSINAVVFDSLSQAHACRCTMLFRMQAHSALMMRAVLKTKTVPTDVTQEEVEQFVFEVAMGLVSKDNYIGEDIAPRIPERYHGDSKICISLSRKEVLRTVPRSAKIDFNSDELVISGISDAAAERISDLVWHLPRNAVHLQNIVEFLNGRTTQ